MLLLTTRPAADGVGSSSNSLMVTGKPTVATIDQAMIVRGSGYIIGRISTLPSTAIGLSLIACIPQNRALRRVDDREWASANRIRRRW